MSQVHLVLYFNAISRASFPQFTLSLPFCTKRSSTRLLLYQYEHDHWFYSSRLKNVPLFRLIRSILVSSTYVSNSISLIGTSRMATFALARWKRKRKGSSSISTIYAICSSVRVENKSRGIVKRRRGYVILLRLIVRKIAFWSMRSLLGHCN